MKILTKFNKSLFFKYCCYISIFLLFLDLFIFASPVNEFQKFNLNPKSQFAVTIENDSIKSDIIEVMQKNQGILKNTASTVLEVLKRNSTFVKYKKNFAALVFASCLFIFPPLCFPNDTIDNSFTNIKTASFEIVNKRTDWLISQLSKTSDFEILHGIMNELIEITPASKKDFLNNELFNYLKSKQTDNKLKILIIETLGKNKYLPALDLITDYFTDSDPKIRQTAAKALVNLGSASADYLLKELENDDWFIKTLALESISELKNIEHMPKIKECLYDEFFEVRKASAKVLEILNFNPNSVTEKLFYYLAKGNFSSIIELGQSALPELEKALDKKYWKIYEGNYRAEIIKTLGIISVKKSLPILIEQLFDDDPLVANQSEVSILSDNEIYKDVYDFFINEKKDERKLRILQLLKKFDAPNIYDFMEKIVENDDLPFSLRLSASEILLKTNPDLVLSLIKSIINDTWRNQNDVNHAISLAGKIGEKAHFIGEKILTKIKSDSKENDETKLNTINTLGKINYKEAIPEILLLLHDYKSNIRHAAAKALQELKYEPKTDNEKLSFYIALRDFEKIISFADFAYKDLVNVFATKDGLINDFLAKCLIEIIRNTNDLKLIADSFLISDFNISIEAIKRAGDIGALDTAVLLDNIRKNRIKFNEEENKNAEISFEKIKFKSNIESWNNKFEKKSIDYKKLISVFITAVSLLYSLILLINYFMLHIFFIKNNVKNIKKTFLPLSKTFEHFLQLKTINKISPEQAKETIKKLTLDLEIGEFEILINTLLTTTLTFWTYYIFNSFYFTNNIFSFSLFIGLMICLLTFIKLLFITYESELGNFIVKYDMFTFPIKIIYLSLLFLISFNSLTTFHPVIIIFTSFLSIYSFLHTDKGSIILAKIFNKLKSIGYFIWQKLYNPFLYFKLNMKYAKLSDVRNYEHFYFIQHYGESEINELLNKFKNKFKKFEDEANEKLIIKKITEFSYHKSKSWNEKVLVLKYQTAIALDIANNYKDFVKLIESNELFEIIKHFKSDTVTNLFNDLIKNSKGKFSNKEMTDIFISIIQNAYNILNEKKDVRNYLEIQLPVVFEMTSNIDDFNFYIGILNSILSGKYDIKLTNDKSRFKAFFQKVGNELRFKDHIVFFETIGLIELRVKQQGFNVEHFYDEVFQTFKPETLESSIDIIFEIVKNCGLFPTESLINIAKETINKTDLYKNWNEELKIIREGGFNINNPLHIEFEYSSFRRIIDNSTIVSNQFKNYSYKNYIDYALKKSAAVTLNQKNEAELIYAGYEASRLGNFIEELKVKAESYGREVWVIPNLSYGRFASIFIDGNLKMDDIEIVLAKIGSSETHENPYYIDPTFIKGQVLERMVTEKPVIVVVDGSYHLERYPDAHQGYLNLSIALNDVISNGNIEEYNEQVGRSIEFINDLKSKPEFKAITKIIKQSFEKSNKKDKALFSFHFWNPRGKELSIRSSWKTRRGSVGKPKPVDIENVKGPSFIFVNSVLTDDDIPDYVKEKAFGIHHDPAHYDDVKDIKIINLLFKFDDFGIHLSDIMHEAEMHAANGFVKRVKEGDTYKHTAIQTLNSALMENDLNNELESGKNQIKIKRLLDELESDNSKIRADAAASLAEFIGNQTISTKIIKALYKEKEDEPKYWMITAIAAIGVKESITDLTRIIINEENPIIVKEIVTAIKKLSDKRGIPSLVKINNKFKSLSSVNIEIRREIMLAYRSIQTDEVLNHLLDALINDKSETVRATAGEAYLDVGAEKAVLNALNCLKDPSPSVREMLIEGIGDLAPKNVFGKNEQEVLNKLYEVLLYDDDKDVKYKAAWALGQIENIDTLDVLKYALELPSNSDILEIINSSYKRLSQIISKTYLNLTNLEISQKPLENQNKDKTDINPIIKFQGKEIDVSKIKAFIFDLDDTIAELSQPLTPKMNETLINLLNQGIQVVINTADIESRMETRVFSQIPKSLRKNLHFYTNEGSIAFGFNENGDKVYYYNNNQNQTFLNNIQDIIKQEKITSEKTIISSEYFVAINLMDKSKKERKAFAKKVEKILNTKKLSFKLWFKSKFLFISNFDKSDAVNDFMSRFNISEENLLIAGDKARSYDLDRTMLEKFTKAVSINFGESSPTIESKNPSIIQSGIKNVLGVTLLLNKVINIIVPIDDSNNKNIESKYFHPKIGIAVNIAQSVDELKKQISDLLIENSIITDSNKQYYDELMLYIEKNSKNSLENTLLIFKNLIIEEFEEVNILIKMLADFVESSELNEDLLSNQIIENLIRIKLSNLYKKNYTLTNSYSVNNLKAFVKAA